MASGNQRPTSPWARCEGTGQAEHSTGPWLGLRLHITGLPTSAPTVCDSCAGRQPLRSSAISHCFRSSCWPSWFLGLSCRGTPRCAPTSNAALQDALPLLFSDDGDENPVDVESVAEATAPRLCQRRRPAARRLGLGQRHRRRHSENARCAAASPKLSGAQAGGSRCSGGCWVDDPHGVGGLGWRAFCRPVGARSLGIELSSGWLLQLSADVLAAVLVALVIAAFYWFSWNRPDRRWRSVLTAAFMAVVCALGC